MAQYFTVAFRLLNHETSDSVFYKVDGGRFENTQTVKLIANTEYDVRLTLKPKVDVKRVTINGEMFKVNPVKSDDNEWTYTCQYTTPAVPTKTGKRDTLHFTVDLTNGAYLKLQIQCKIYNAGEKKHSEWGEKLASINLDCRHDDGHNFITVMKEKYW